MKYKPEQLAWRVVYYRRSGIWRAQKLPKSMACKLSKEQAVALASDRNLEDIARKLRYLDYLNQSRLRLSKEISILQAHVWYGERRPECSA